MRLLLIFTLAAAAICSAASNSITITNTSGSAIAAQPQTISRVFVKGEISGYPRPSIDGTPLAQWQADVMTRWRDGSGSCAVSGATIGPPIVVTCAAAHGFLDGESVTISGVGGNTAANGTWKVWAPTATTLQLVNATGNGAYTNGGTATGPAYGSVAHALITFPLSIGAGGNAVVSFVNDANPCHLGNLATCQAAALTQQQMLDFNTGGGAGSWGAAIQTTANGVVLGANAKTMLTQGAWRYWLRGPLVTQAIIEDRTARAFDFGYKDRYSTVVSPAGTGTSITATATSLPVADSTEICVQTLPTIIRVHTRISPTYVYEDMSVTACAGNTLTVTRGVNGTTATLHLINDLVTVESLKDVNPDGWKQRALAVTLTNYTNTISATATSFMVNTPEGVANHPVPFTIKVADEEMTVCGFSELQNSAATFRIGQSSCPNADGRGRNGTTAVRHQGGEPIYPQPVTSIWIAAPTPAYMSLHPVFTATFYSGWNGVKLMYGLENMWFDRLQNQTFDIALQAGQALDTTFRASRFHLSSNTRWMDEYWYGSTPGSTNIDHNLAYMVMTGAIWNYDTSIALNASAVTTQIARETTVGTLPAGVHYGPGGWGSHETAMPGAGGRPDIGPLTTWDMLYLYSFNESLAKVAQADASIHGSIPMHYRWATNGTNFDKRGTNPFGRGLSPDASSFVSWNGAAMGTNAVGFVAHVKRGSGPPSRFGSGWNIDIAHQTAGPHVTYLTTGNWWYLEELLQWASWDLMVTNPGIAVSTRHNDWGITLLSDFETRGQAWVTRALSFAAFDVPNAMPESTWLREKLANNAAVREGIGNLTTGTFYEPYSGSKWHWGRTVHAANKPVGTIPFIGTNGSVDPRYPLFGSAGSFLNALPIDKPNDCYMTDGRDSGASIWQENFSLLSWGLSRDMGFDFWTPLVSHVAGRVIQMTLDPTFTPKYMLAAGYTATAAAPDPTPLATWTAVLARNCTKEKNDAANRWVLGCLHGGSVEEPYPCIIKASASYTPGVTNGSYYGDAAWSWIKSNVTNQQAEKDNPKWAIVPRVAGSPIFTLSPSTFAFRYTINGAAAMAQALTVGAVNTTLTNWAVSNTQSWLTATPSNGFTSGASSLSVNPTGLAPGTYTDIITGNSTDTSNSPTATVSLTVYAAPTFTPSTLPDGVVGTPYSQTLVGSGGQTPYTWAVTSGALPAGLTLNSSSGTITGTPTANGASTFTVRLSEAGGVTVSQSYTVIVTGGVIGNNGAVMTGIVQGVAGK
jgi:hypothetical protein